MAHSLHPAAVERTSDEARNARSQGAWAMARDPEGTRQATVELLANPPADASAVWLRAFGRSYKAITRLDWEINTLLLHHDEYVFRAAGLAETLPDAKETYMGVEGYLRALDLVFEAWTEVRVEALDVLRTGPDQAVSLMRWTAKGARSGLPLDWRCVGDHRFRDGLVIEQTYWWNAERAVEELGL